MPTLRYLVLALLMTMQAAWAQSFPDKSRPIKIIAPSGAASLADLLARAFSRGMADVAGLNVIVENKPGAEGVIGLQAV